MVSRRVAEILRKIQGVATWRGLARPRRKGCTETFPISYQNCNSSAKAVILRSSAIRTQPWWAGA